MKYRIATLLFVVVTIAAVSNGKRFYITRHGACTDCAYHDGTKYLWCHLGTRTHDWDYCSTEPGYSSKGQKCKEGHQCGYHGYTFYWCSLENGGWDYCSPIEDTNFIQYTLKANDCHNYCDLEFGTYVCRIDDHTSEECSPVNGVTSSGPGCVTPDLFKDGKNSCHWDKDKWSFWCYTKNGWLWSSWDYCSWSRVDANVFPQPRREKRAVSRTCSTNTGTRHEEIQRYEQPLANGGALVTAIIAEEPNSRRIRVASRSQREDAQMAMYTWHNGQGSSGGSTTETTYGQIRLDRQGFVQTSQGPFENWQLQINGANLQFPTSIAQVLIPSELQAYAGPTRDKTRGWRRMLIGGLHHSLNRGATVWIFQQVNRRRNGNLECPRRGS